MTVHKDDPGSTQDKMVEIVSEKAQRKIDARAKPHANAWFGLGMMGLIGWSVAIPTLCGVAMGLWIDRHWESQFSWTLMLLFLGGFLGCLNAWRWLNKEGRKID